MYLNQHINARLNAACSSHSGGDVQGFFYIDGIPTKGIWVDLLPVRSWDDVREALEVAYPDSVVDEILMADYEGAILKPFYSSSCDGFSMTEWADFAAELESTHLDMKVIEAYSDNASSWEDVTIQNIEDSYVGEYDSDTAFAEGYADDMGLLMNVPETVKNYFDFEAYWKCELRHYFYESNGHYFRNL
jgi:antirestriction protein